MSHNHVYNWKGFIDFSEMLFYHFGNETVFTNCNSETIFRVICSRAYYGIFKQIEDFLRDNTVELPEYVTRRGRMRRLGSHEKIRMYVEQRNRNLSTLLRRLSAIRTKADYDKRVEISEEYAQISIEKAKEAYNLFEQYRNGLI